MYKVDEKRDMLQEAEEVLSDILSNGPVEASEAKKQATIKNVSMRTLERAKASLGVISRKSGGQGTPWLWEPPKEMNKPAGSRINKGDEQMYKDKVVINGTIYTPANEGGPTKIVILQRGWCMIGRFERDGSDCKLRDAAVIRQWGTTSGLGQIAEGGPTVLTKLDKCYGVVEFDYLTVVATIDCEEAAWQNVL